MKLILVALIFVVAAWLGTCAGHFMDRASLRHSAQIEELAR